MIPFACSDKNDGFFEKCISAPWQQRHDSALEKLDLLLSGVMMRHSKTQRTSDGHSIVDLPPIKCRHEGLEPSESERATSYFLEALTAKLCTGRLLEDATATDAQEFDADDTLARDAARRAAAEKRRNGAVALSLMQLQRQVATSPVLLAGGPGVTQQLKQLDGLLRRVAAMDAANGNAGNGAIGGNDMHVLPINRAYSSMLQGQRRQQQQSDGFIGVTTTHFQQGGRGRNNVSAFERLDRAQTEVDALELRVRGEKKRCCRMRWRFAVEMISRGEGLNLQLVLPPPDVERQNNAVEAYFDLLPPRLLMKTVRHVRMHEPIKAGREALEAAIAQAQTLDDTELVDQLHERNQYRKDTDAEIYANLELIEKEVEDKQKALKEKLETRSWAQLDKRAAELEVSEDTLETMRRLNQSQILRAELGKLPLGQLKRKAHQAEISDERVKAELAITEEAETAKEKREEGKAIMVDLLLEATDEPAHVDLVALETRAQEACVLVDGVCGQIEGAKIALLRLIAGALGAAEEALEMAEETVDPKASMIEMIVGLTPHKTEHRRHCERMFVKPQRMVLDEAKQKRVKEAPIGWRRPAQTPATGGSSSEWNWPNGESQRLPVSSVVRGEAKGLEVFKNYPAEARKSWEVVQKTARDLDKLLPWLAICRTAAEAEEASEDAAPRKEQIGFETIQGLMEGSTDTKCPICLDSLILVDEGKKQTVVTQCLHLFCKECMTGHLDSFHLVSEATECPCPICRRIVRKHELTVLAPRDDDKMELANGNGGATTSAAVDNGDTSVATERTGPTLSEAANEQAFMTVPLPRGPLHDLIPGMPALPRQLMTHLAHAASVPNSTLPGSSSDEPRPSNRSTKILRLLQDIMKMTTGPDPGKVVVFSQAISAIKHISKILEGLSIRHVKICQGEQHDAISQAVEDFNTVDDCSIFLLHAGTAAAGLTLTAARHVILLEPFISAAEEAQAMNRAHRIGQRREVSVTTYYMKNTIEERLLAFRQLSGEDQDQVQSLEGGAGAGQSGGDGHGLTAAKLRCIFGLVDEAGARKVALQERQQAEAAVVAAKARAAAAAMMDVVDLTHDDY